MVVATMADLDIKTAESIARLERQEGRRSTRIIIEVSNVQNIDS